MGLGIYATEIERHAIDLVEITIPISGLPEAFHGFRIVQLSDIHLEEFTEDIFLRHVVRRVNALAPDMVLLTGDFVSFGPRHHEFARGAAVRCGAILRDLESPLKYAVLGNHDVTIGAFAVINALKVNGITPLVNEYLPIDRGDQRIWLAGLADASVGRPNLDLTIPTRPDGPVILMCHEPDYTDTIVRHPRGNLVDLILSGHTHGGQVRLPLIPLQLPPMGMKYVEGHFRFEQTQLYVNRGIGSVGLPIRFNCPPEITHITLLPA
jgi:predicted MPP superfamily phosphohydrolase